MTIENCACLNIIVCERSIRYKLDDTTQQQVTTIQFTQKYVITHTLQYNNRTLVQNLQTVDRPIDSAAIWIGTCRVCRDLLCRR